MMSKIFDFGRIKAGRDMDLYVNMLNEPKIEKEIQKRRDARRERDRIASDAKARERTLTEDLDRFVVKVAMAICFCVTIISVVYALRL